MSRKLFDVETINAPLESGTEIQILMCCSVEKIADEGKRGGCRGFWCRVSVALQQNSCFVLEVPQNVRKDSP